MHIKICGITNLDDARAALDAGADLLGFNFYRPSPRYVAPTVAAAIIEDVRRTSQSASDVKYVGVFVNAPLDEVCAIRAACALDLVQLHGDETAAYVRALGAGAFKALRPTSAEQAGELVEKYHPLTLPSRHWGEGVPHFLLDASHPSLYGGTGATGDWHIAREVAVQHPILLAGGLNPANVADAIRLVRPWGVDVASGVERAPGVKDADKLKQFMAAVRNGG